jgi:thioredoxin-related protein
MKRLLVGLFLVLGSISVVSSAQERIIKVVDLEITSYEDSLVLAKNQDKKVLVFFSADYCGWCKKQKDVFLESAVVDKINDYVICYVDMSKKDLVSKYNVRTIPAYFVIDKNEKIIKKNIGYKEKNDFIRWLDN